MMCSRVESSKVKASQGSVLSRSGSAGESGGVGSPVGVSLGDSRGEGLCHGY